MFQNLAQRGFWLSCLWSFGAGLRHSPLLETRRVAQKAFLRRYATDEYKHQENASFKENFLRDFDSDSGLDRGMSCCRHRLLSLLKIRFDKVSEVSGV